MSISGSYSNQNSESYIKKLKKLAILKKDIFKKQLEPKFLSFDEPNKNYIDINKEAKEELSCEKISSNENKIKESIKSEKKAIEEYKKFTKKYKVNEADYSEESELENKKLIKN